MYNRRRDTDLMAFCLTFKGGLETTVRLFMTAGHFSVELSVKFNPYESAKQYFDAGEPECDWDSMKKDILQSHMIFDATCVVTDPFGKEIGRSTVGICTSHTTTSDATFIRQIRKHYGRRLFTEAFNQAREAYPKHHDRKQQQAA